MKKKLHFSSIVLSCLLTLSYSGNAQVIRNYSIAYSDNIKGSATMFGNTIMQIVDNGAVNTTKMNETGNSANGHGGIGFGQYGNDNENMQFTSIDQSTIFGLGASGWYYLDDGSNQSTTWRTLSSPGSPWKTGTASFGYSYSENTTIDDNHVTAYFLKTVNIPNVTAYSQFNFSISYDDGAVVYVNGVEVKRSNMPAGTIAYNTTAPSSGSATGEAFVVPASYFTSGNNVIAVEIHQRSAGSSDCYFDLSLSASRNTTNSSSADFTLPAGTNTIKFARLYWGGRIANTVIAAAPDTLRKIKIRKGNNSYTSLTTAAANVDQFAITLDNTVYQAYADITSFFHTSGTETYTIADLPASTGAISGGGNYGGWCIVVAYSNPALSYNSVRIYDGFLQVYNSGSTTSQTIVLSGLNVPSNPLSLSDAVMSTMAWEGDANLSSSSANPDGDFLKINGNTYSNAVNPATNMWNGTISKNGSYVTTKSPDFTNQMGIDIDEAQIGTGYGILPNASSVSIQFGTEADQYFPSVLGFAIKMKDPTITLDKTVADATGDGYLASSELLTYTISGSNSGAGTAFNCVVTDTLPANSTYVPGTLELISSPGLTAGIKTDVLDGDIAMTGLNGIKQYIKFNIGTGATASTGGQLASGESYSLKFKVKAGIIPGTIVNTARINATSQVGDPFVDDGTAVIGAAPGPPLSVKLISFTGTVVNSSALLKWATEAELMNDHFDIERSEDAIHFNTRGTVKGNGTTETRQEYQYTDALNTNANVLYYRLKIVDVDGKYSYSQVIPIRVNGSGIPDELVVYPNPFISDIKVSVNSDTQEDGIFNILAVDGKLVVSRKVSIQKGANIIVLKDLNLLQSGTYVLQVIKGNEKTTRKLMKN